MNANNSVVAVFDSHETAEAAVKKLTAGGFDMKNLLRPSPRVPRSF